MGFAVKNVKKNSTPVVVSWRKKWNNNSRFVPNNELYSTHYTHHLYSPQSEINLPSQVLLIDNESPSCNLIPLDWKTFRLMKVRSETNWKRSKKLAVTGTVLCNTGLRVWVIKHVHLHSTFIVVDCLDCWIVTRWIIHPGLCMQLDLTFERELFSFLLFPSGQLNAS